MTVLNLALVHRESVQQGKLFATESFNSISNTARREISSLIDPVLAMGRTAAALPPAHQGELTWDKAMAAFFRGATLSLYSHPNILAVNYGYADGTFYSVTSLVDDKVRANYKAPPQAVLAVWAVANDEKGVRREWWSFLDSNFKEITARSSDPKYDPRTRTWYKEGINAESLTMTPPYIFNTSKEMGMAVALPLRQKDGVFSINITLRNFDGLLESIPLTKSGYMFILDEQKRIIGERSPQHASQKMATNKAHRGEYTRQLLPLEFYPQPEVASIASQLGKCENSTHAVLLNLQGEDYFLACEKIAMGPQQIDLVMLTPMRDFSGLAEKFFTRTMFFAILTMLIFIPISAWLSFRIGNSLNALLRETLRVKHMDWKKPRTIVTRIREIRRLAHAISSMRKSIQKSTDALKHAQNTLEDTVEQRTAQLSQALEVAEEATQAKSKFLSTVSHEIRTPMNAIVGFTYLFDKSNLTDKQTDYLDKIRISSETLLRIINDVLDFSKIEAGRLEIEHIPFHLATVLDTVISITKFPAREKRLELVVTLADDVPLTLMGDPTRLHQVLLNLLSNAIKFTDTGKVELTVSKTSSQPAMDNNQPHDVTLLFRVSDTGIGMEEEQIQRIFTPFAQADNSITRKYGGTGLGLAICKQLVELMDGTIKVRSTLGQGTIFDVSVVLSALPTAPVLKQKEVETRAVWRHGARVLVVDDNAINREIAGALLESAHLHVDFAENGLEAVHKIKDNCYDLIFMDMQMPVMDGLEAARIIRSMGKEDVESATPPLDVPIIAMTANAMTEDKHRCLEAGMNDHVSKPIVPTVLMGLLGLWLPPQSQI